MIELMGLAATTSHVEVIEVYAGKNLLKEAVFTDNTVESQPPNSFSSPNNTIADHLEAFPGLNKTGQGGLFQSYSIRGLGGWRIRTNVDGIPIITDRRAGNSASFLPAGLVSLYDVNKGSNSLLHGSGAMGGVLNISTIKPEQPLFTLAHQMPADATSLTVGYGTLSNSIATSVRHSQNEKSASGQPLHAQYTQFAAALYQQGHLFERFDYNISWIPSMGSDIGKSSNQYPDYQVAVYPEDNHSLLQATLHTDRWLFKAFHHYQNWDSLVERINKRENLTRYQSHTYGSNLYSSAHGQLASWRFGIDWVSRNGIKISDRETSTDNLVTEQALIDGHTINLAPYVSTAIKLNDMTVNLGVRYDYFKAQNTNMSRSDNHISYQASAERQRENQLLKVSYSTAFRFPSMTELYFNGVTPRGDTFGNPSLNPETSNTFEFNYIYSHQTFSGRFNLYQSKLENFIERTKLPSGDRTYNNLQHVDLNGFELAFDFTPFTGHSLSWNVAKQSAKQNNGHYVQGIAPIKANIKHRFTWREVELSTEITHRFRKTETGSGEQPLPSATMINTYAKWQFDRHWVGTIKVSNLLNKAFLTTADEDAPEIPQRQISFQLDWRN
ncbi:TonB-dependent receptor [Pseudoalteromonas sp. SMS1]|uniref:TonB-dependent receptor n=1 Tax=Pseudoalteromonas sp. SMS1 TaxID=2908894 RepID=UPI001F1CC5FB|nr:TonB-dependent receptor [Pseudoalteromonas sp. SMS1]MCF2856052.1 TonB-dependent receptor [Pseudoalteromonas sp. SMS1]